MSNPISVSLHKANKFKHILKKLCDKQKVNQLKEIVQVQYNANNPVTLETFKLQIDTKIKEARDEIDTYIRLKRDYRILKDLVFSANVNSRVSDILSQIEILEMVKNVYTSLLTKSVKPVNHHNQLTVDIDSSYAALSREKENNYSYNNNVTYAVYNKPELKNKIQSISKKINELEDERDRINNNTSIQLNRLDDITLEELGL